MTTGLVSVLSIREAILILQSDTFSFWWKNEVFIRLTRPSLGDYRSKVIDESSIDGKSDDYDEKLLGGEKKSTPSANLCRLESKRCQFFCIF